MTCFEKLGIDIFKKKAVDGIVVFTYNDEQRTCTCNSAIINTFLERPTIKGEVSSLDFLPTDSDYTGMLMLELTRGSVPSESIKRFNFSKIQWNL